MKNITGISIIPKRAIKMLGKEPERIFQKQGVRKII
jgi:hypothetical protein